MEFLNHLNIDFMKWRRFWVVVSVLVIAAGMVALFVEKELNIGIDFAGGTQIVIRFKNQPDVDTLRKLLEEAGLRESVIQRYGKVEENQVMLRAPTLAGTEEGSGAKLVAALVAKYDAGLGGLFDLNREGRAELTNLLASADPDGVGAESGAAHYAGVAESIMGVRKQRGLLTDWSQIESAPGVSARVMAQLKAKAGLGDFAILSLENVGPQVGSELRRRGELAVVFSLIGMMVYIWFRFELRFGIGAIMASIHDVLITLGLFTIAGFEFNLTTIAAFLTLVGYSTNDTVVVFDRVRENLRKSRSQPLIEVMNHSINQTLSRTLLTSGLTFIASLALFVLGGDVIRGFAFVMTVGVVVGTYSSIFIASPFALLWEQWFGPGGKMNRATAASPASAKR
jgi:preprotein translocase subunit SecF